MNTPPIPDQVYCRDCGQTLSPRAVICPHCGIAQRPVGKKSRILAIILAFFLGGLGFHKFYLGRPVQGLFYLLFCWTGIPWLIALVEFIIYIFMSDEEFALKYG